MKKFILAVACIAVATVSAYAQETKANPQEVVNKIAKGFNVHSRIVINDQTGEQTVTDMTSYTGFGIEPWVGASYFDKRFTPEIGLRARYDGRYVFGGLGANALTRQYNEEAMSAGKQYLAYAAEAFFGVNLIYNKKKTFVVGLFGKGGYLFGKHDYEVGEIEAIDGTYVTSVYHNGSGVIYGGGLEARWTPFLKTHSWVFRVEVTNSQDVHVNSTPTGLRVGASIGYNFGIGRRRAKLTNNGYIWK